MKRRDVSAKYPPLLLLHLSGQPLLGDINSLFRCNALVACLLLTARAGKQAQQGKTGGELHTLLSHPRRRSAIGQFLPLQKGFLLQRQEAPNSGQSYQAARANGRATALTLSMGARLADQNDVKFKTVSNQIQTGAPSQIIEPSIQSSPSTHSGKLNSACGDRAATDSIRRRCTSSSHVALPHSVNAHPSGPVVLPNWGDGRTSSMRSNAAMS